MAYTDIPIERDRERISFKQTEFGVPVLVFAYDDSCYYNAERNDYILEYIMNQLSYEGKVNINIVLQKDLGFEDFEKYKRNMYDMYRFARDIYDEMVYGLRVNEDMAAPAEIKVNTRFRRYNKSITLEFRLHNFSII